MGEVGHGDSWLPLLTGTPEFRVSALGEGVVGDSVSLLCLSHLCLCGIAIASLGLNNLIPTCFSWCLS
jgi:hypothetical protein